MSFFARVDWTRAGAASKGREPPAHKRQRHDNNHKHSVKEDASSLREALGGRRQQPPRRADSGGAPWGRPRPAHERDAAAIGALLPAR